MKSFLPDYTVSKVLLDSAHDAMSYYQYFKRENITPFIDLNGKGRRPPIYKNDFIIDKDGVPICLSGYRMRRDGIEVAKGRMKFKCPKISYAGGGISCTCETPCSNAKYGRTVHLVLKDNPRLFNNPSRSSKEWKLEYNARTSAERSNKREKLDFNELGLNMTTVINMFLRTVVREYGIPFELKLDVPQETAAEAALESKKMLSDLSECKSSNEETIKG